MKEKIMYLILGILIGAVITAGCFLLFTKNNGPEMMDGKMGERPDFENMTDEEREEMKEKRGNFDGEKPDGAPEENERGRDETEDTSTSDITNGSDTNSTENS